MDLGEGEPWVGGQSKVKKCMRYQRGKDREGRTQEDRDKGVTEKSGR